MPFDPIYEILINLPGFRRSKLYQNAFSSSMGDSPPSSSAFSDPIYPRRVSRPLYQDFVSPDLGNANVGNFFSYGSYFDQVASVFLFPARRSKHIPCARADGRGAPFVLYVCDGNPCFGVRR